MSELSKSALPRSIVSLSALAEGAQRAVAQARLSRHASLIADLRRDAWGHGLRATATALADAGAHAVLVDDDDVVAALRDVDLEARTVASSASAPDIDMHTLLGLPDDDGVLTGRPAMRLTGRVMSLKTIHAGGGVSYGYTYRAARESCLALVTGGYAQGIVRALGNRASVDIAGASFPIVGRIAMDVSVVDLGDADIAEGATVTYFGGGTTSSALHDWHRFTGFSVAELVTVVGVRTLREWEA